MSFKEQLEQIKNKAYDNYESNLELMNILEDMLEIIQEQSRVLEFYGDATNYTEIYNENEMDLGLRITEEDCEFDDESEYFGYAGKKARQTQAIVLEKLKEVGNG